MQRLQYSLQLSCVPEETACQNIHRAGALGKSLIKPSGSLWDLWVSGSASAEANHYMEVKFTLTKVLSRHQRQISYKVFAYKLGTQLQNSTEYQGWLNIKVPVLIRGPSESVCTLGMHQEIQRCEAKRCSRLVQVTQRGGREGLQNQALQRSPCGLLGNDGLQFAALQLPGKMGNPVTFRLPGPSPASHMESPGMRDWGFPAPSLVQ